MAAIYVARQKYAEAVDFYQQCLKLSPTLAEAHYELAKAYLILGDRPSALQQYVILKPFDGSLADRLYDEIYK